MDFNSCRKEQVPWSRSFLHLTIITKEGTFCLNEYLPGCTRRKWALQGKYYDKYIADLQNEIETSRRCLCPLSRQSIFVIETGFSESLPQKTRKRTVVAQEFRKFSKNCSVSYPAEYRKASRGMRTEKRKQSTDTRGSRWEWGGNSTPFVLWSLEHSLFFAHRCSLRAITDNRGLWW